jgi:hypothetical protein
MRTTQRKRIEGNSMTAMDWVQIVFLVLVVGVGLGGFVWAAMKKD